MAKQYFLSGWGEFSDFIVEVLKSDRDAVIIVDGDTGEGKTTAETHVMSSLAYRMGMFFNPVRQMVYDKHEFNKALDELPEFSAIGVDEAVGLFYSRDYQDQEQIALLKKLDRIRYRHLCILLVIPSIMHIDKHIRDSRVRYWIHVDSRKGRGESGHAHAFIFQKEKNPFNPDPWNIKRNRYLFSKGQIQDSPNYVGELYFRDVPGSWHGVLKDVKDLKRRRAEAVEWRRAKSLKKWKRGGTGESIGRGLKA